MRDSLAALRLIVEGLRDGVLNAPPQSGVLDQMMLHVLLLSDLLDEQVRSRETRCGAAIAQRVGIASFLARWSDSMRPKAEQREVDLQLVVAASLPDIECRASQVARVVLNLIDNAISHARAGGIVEVRAIAHPGGVQVQVNDDGPGLPEAQRAALNGESRLASRSARPGLVIARTIVESHGGKLWATSPPRGASVRFYLPATARVAA